MSAAVSPGTSSYPMHLLDQTGVVIETPSQADVEARLASGTFFWLDLPTVGDQELAWLRDVFKLHPLAIDDAQHFGERPKLDDYETYSIMVLYGTGAQAEESVSSLAAAEPRPPATAAADGSIPVEALEAVAEIHCVVAEKYLLTVHRGNCPSLRAYAQRALAHKVPYQSPARLVYQIADILIDSFFPILAELDDRIDLLQAAMMDGPNNDQLAELLRYRSALIGMRRVVAPQRDVFASLAAGVTDLPSFSEDDNRYLRDVYDHLIHLSDLIDGYRDLLSGTTDAYLSVVSNQLNIVMKQLSIIATVFLPLSFLTGFFGQNFSWLVNGLNGVAKFFILGLGTEVIAVAALVLLFRKRGWLGKSEKSRTFATDAPRAAGGP